jgi:hypothetical protein
MLSLHRRILKAARSFAQRHDASAWLPDSIAGLARGLVQWSHTRYHDLTMRRAVSGRSSNLADIEEFLRANAIPLKAPLVLISQVQRSGGTLLSQLLDGHPAVAAYPHELRFGYSVADRWPAFNPAAPADDNFRALFDLKFGRLMRRGFMKGEQSVETHRFFMVPRMQYLVYKRVCETSPPRTLRDDLDAHFTAFFNAWLDYQGQLDRKTWVSAFAPRLAIDEGQAAVFFETYPDGRLIQIIRDPHSWYASARRHRKSLLAGDSIDDLLALWIASAESMLRNRERYGDRVIIVGFEELVRDTERSMRLLSERLGISYNSGLTEPTFNGRPMRANSSFSVPAAGVIDAPLKRNAALSDLERRQIGARCDLLFERVASLALGRAGAEPAQAARSTG